MVSQTLMKNTGYIYLNYVGLNVVSRVTANRNTRTGLSLCLVLVHRWSWGLGWFVLITVESGTCMLQTFAGDEKLQLLSMSVYSLYKYKLLWCRLSWPSGFIHSLYMKVQLPQHILQKRMSWIKLGYCVLSQLDQYKYKAMTGYLCKYIIQIMLKILYPT